jgi:epoxyqueuosine reductase
MQIKNPSLSQQIKLKAKELGFDGVGFSKAGNIEGFAESFQNWLQAGFHAGMDYMERNSEKRMNPAVLVPGAKSVISLIISYYPATKQSETIPQIAKYAYGTDYHWVLKEKMQQLWEFIKVLEPALDGRIFVDSAPVSDKLWAVKGGLGWIGKNSCLINKEFGSFVFIGELIISLELEYDEHYSSNFCGSCTKCIDACPTSAIVQPGIIDSNKCISYLTIENKADTVPQELAVNLGHRIFGCDTCQDVCPWNKKPLITSEKAFEPSADAFNLSLEDWEQMEPTTFKKLFQKSPLMRAKLKGLKRNVAAVAANQQHL